MVKLNQNECMVKRLIKYITNYLLRKGIGILRIHVFVAGRDTKLTDIILNKNVEFGAHSDRVLNDICVVRGKKKYNQLKKIQSRGGYVVSLYHENELAAYGWVGINIEKNGRRMFTSFAIPENSAHIFECYTVEKFRGRSFYPAIVSKLTEWALSHDAKNVYIDTIVGNVNAEKGIYKLGFQYIFCQTKLLILNKVIVEYDRKG